MSSQVRAIHCTEPGDDVPNRRTRTKQKSAFFGASAVTVLAVTARSLRIAYPRAGEARGVEIPFGGNRRIHFFTDLRLTVRRLRSR